MNNACDAPPRIPRVGIRAPHWATFTGEVAAGVVDYMRLHSRWTLVTENNAEGELETVKLDAAWRGDGLITFRCSADEAAAWTKNGVAVVNISEEGATGNHPRVFADNDAIGRLAARHLMETGLTSFAFVSRAATHYTRAEWAPGERRYTRERLAAYRDELAKSGFTCETLLLPARDYAAPETWKAVRDDIRAFLEKLPRPCGLFTADDPLGIAAIRAADTLGLRVPQDLAVLGFGDDPVYCNHVTPALSSVRYPGREIGYEAARIIDRQLTGVSAGPAETRVPVTHVVCRESSDFLAIKDAEVARLVTIIRRRAPGDPLQVSELIELSQLSASTVKERFNLALGHGPKQEILNTRIRHLRRLLTDSALSPDKISDSMKFASVAEMTRFLLRHTGEKVTDLRRRGA